MSKEKPLYCNFCGNSTEEVEYMMGAQYAYICNFCVALFDTAISAERMKKEKSNDQT